jgi:hypothetical protein
VSPNVLRRLPLVSDQGKGLEGFIKQINDILEPDNVMDQLTSEEKFELVVWLLCHRHLIENASAGSWAGDCVSQLLLCCHPDDIIVVAQRIRQEIKEIFNSPEAKSRFCDPKNHRVLKSILLAVQTELIDGNDAYADFNEKGGLKIEWEPPVNPIPMEAWARWLREGCPTTSNAIESIHRWLNDLLKELCNAKFHLRYLRVVAFLEKRFTERNSECRVRDRSTVRFQRQRAQMKQHLSAQDEHLLQFNRALHGIPGQPWEDEDDVHWEFPEYDPPATKCRVDSVVITKGPPDSWKTERDEPLTLEQIQKVGLLNLDMPDDANLFPQEQVELAGAKKDPLGIPKTPVNFSHYDAAWRIIRSVRRLVSEASWESAYGFKVVIPRVFELGRSYLHMDPLPIEVEVGWKFAALDDLNVKLVV